MISRLKNTGNIYAIFCLCLTIGCFLCFLLDQPLAAFWRVFYDAANCDRAQLKENDLFNRTTDNA